MYQIHGLKIDSDIKIPFCNKMDKIEPDVVILSKKVPTSIFEPEEVTPFFQISQKEFLLEVPNIAKYYVKNGQEIWIEKNSSATLNEIVLFLLDSVFSVLCYQRGLLPLKGCALEKNGKAYIFIGPAGIGKSTLADELIRRAGYKLISDGQVMSDGESVFCGVNSISLWHDMANQINGYDTEKLMPIRPNLKKYWLSNPTSEYDICKIETIYILPESRRDKFSIKKVTAGTKLKYLNKHLSWKFMADYAKYRKSNFILTTKLSQATIFKEVSFFHEYGEDKNAIKLADMIEEDISA